MVEKITESPVQKRGRSDLEPDADNFIGKVIKHKKKKEPRDDMVSAGMQHVMVILHDKSLCVRVEKSIGYSHFLHPAHAGKHQIHADHSGVLFPPERRGSSQIARAGKHNIVAAGGETRVSARYPSGNTRGDDARLTHTEATLRATPHSTAMMADITEGRPHISATSPASSGHLSENTSPAASAMGQIPLPQQHMLPSPGMTPSPRGKPSSSALLSASLQRRQNNMSQVVKDDSQTLRLTYPFQQWHGSHHVSIALHRHSHSHLQQESRVTLLPSDRYTSEALLRQMGDWPARLPDVVYSEAGDKERERRQQQDEQDEDQE